MAEFVHMPSTIWTQISLAKHRGGEALEEILRKYRPPVLAFIRNMGPSPEEAEDLTQDVFLRILEDEVLNKAIRGKGKFRTLLLAVVRHTVQTKQRDAHRLKRGGGVRHVSVDGPGERAEEQPLRDCLAAPAAEEGDDAFDPLWVQNLIRIAMDQLKAECAGGGPPYHRALVLYTGGTTGYPEIAKELGVSTTDVKNYLHQARLRLKRHVLNEIQAYSSSDGEYRSEVAYLTSFLK